jgi:hypothetical protein
MWHAVQAWLVDQEQLLCLAAMQGSVALAHGTNGCVWSVVMTTTAPMFWTSLPTSELQA